MSVQELNAHFLIRRVHSVKADQVLTVQLSEDVFFLGQVLRRHIRIIRVDHQQRVLVIFLEAEFMANLAAPVLLLNLIRETIKVQDSDRFVAVFALGLHDEQVVETSELK